MEKMDVRCAVCGKILFHAVQAELSIRCPKCKAVQEIICSENAVSIKVTEVKKREKSGQL